MSKRSVYFAGGRGNPRPPGGSELGHATGRVVTQPRRRDVFMVHAGDPLPDMANGCFSTPMGTYGPFQVTDPGAEAARSLFRTFPG